MAPSATQLEFGDALTLQLVLPGEKPVAIGVMLHTPSSGELQVRLRQDWESFVPEDELDYVTALAEDLAARVSEPKLLDWLEENCSHILRLSARERVLVAPNTLARLYREHVSSEVRPYETHLPLFGLRAAAGHFSGQQTVEPEGWIEVRTEHRGSGRLKPGQFVATVVGESMLPLIPDGSLCVFEANVTGSRQGRLVLVENRSAGAGERYTVKRYRSEKAQSEDGEWRHERIILEPLNPAFEPWELNEGDDLAVIAEFQYVLD